MPCFTRGALISQTLILPISSPVGRAVQQALVFRADHDIQIFIIYIFIPFMKPFLRHGAFVRQGRDPPVIYDTLTDPRRFVPRIHRDCSNLRKPCSYLFIKCVKGNTVMYISACDYRIQYKVMPVTDCMGFIRKTMFEVPFPEQSLIP